MKIDRETGIMYRQWEGELSRGSILLVHGFGSHSGRWKFLADFFLKNGFSSYAIELKGFGETNSPKGHIGSFDTYFDDIRYRIG